MTCLRLPLLLLVLLVLLARPRGGVLAAPYSTIRLVRVPFSPLGAPHGALEDFLEVQRSLRVSEDFNQLESLGPTYWKSQPKPALDCEAGVSWSNGCSTCVCSPDGRPQCGVDDCSYRGGDGGMLELPTRQDDVLQTLASESHLIILLP